MGDETLRGRAILVHGLGRTRLSMAPLARRLRRRGVDAHTFGYLPARTGVDDIAARLAERLAALDAEGAPLVAVGHSLGGLLLRLAIDSARPRSLVRLVMAGTPNRPPRLARAAVRVPPFRWWSGEAGTRLSDADWFRTLPPLPTEAVIVAGSLGPTGPLSPFGDDPNDCVVSVSETLASDDDRPVVVRATHTFLMNHPAVADAAADALRR